MPDLTPQIDSLFTKWDSPQTPGCMLGVIRHGEFIYQRGYGMANLEYAIPNTADTVFDIASVSKQFTAACVLLAAEHGKLSLDDDVRKFIPELPDYDQTITLRHLIHHTSGLRDYLEGFFISGAIYQPFTAQDILNFIIHQQEVNFKPSEQFLYCNSGYFLLAQIIQRVTGKTLRQFAHERLFSPLGMSNTFFHDDLSQPIANHALGHTPKPDGGYAVSMFTSAIVGEGGVQSTLNDMRLWERHFSENKDFAQSMREIGKLKNGTPTDYAFGIGTVQHRGLTAWRHSGATEGYRAHHLTFPAQEFSVILLANTDDMPVNQLARQAADIYLADEFPEPAPVPVSLTDEQKQAIVGQYVDPAVPSVIRVVEYNGQLAMDMNGSAGLLTPVSPQDFLGNGILSDFIFHITRDELEIRRALPERGGRSRLPRQPQVQNEAEKLAEYAGRYISPELGAERIFSVSDSQLKIEVAPNVAVPLQALTDDLFQISIALLRFEQNANGAVTGCRISTSRARNILFERK